MNLLSTKQVIVLVTTLFVYIFALYNSVPVSGNGNPAFARGERITIECRLLQNGTYGDPVPNQQVEFFDQTYDIYIGSSETDETGFASIQWKIPTIHPVGDTTLNVTFRGNQSLALSPSVQYIGLTVLSPTELIADVHDSRLHPQDILNVSVSLIDDRGYALKSQRIKFLSDGKIVKSGITDDNGLLEFVLSCNQSWAKLGYNQFDIVYDGNSTQYLQSSHRTVELILEKKQTNISISEDDIIQSTLNTTIRVSATLSSGDELLSNATIDVKVDNEHYETISTNGSGIALATLHFNESFALGSHTMNLHYYGTQRYEASGLIRQITVSSPCFVEITKNSSLIINSPNKLTVILYDTLYRPIQAGDVTVTDPITRENYSSRSVNDGKRFFILYPTKEIGPRNLLLSVSNNPFLKNRTCYLPIYVWSRPEFEFLYSSTMGYAVPGQTISFVILLTDFHGPVVHRNVQLLINDKECNTLHSNEKGEVSASVRIPEYAGKHLLMLHFQGNKSAFILERKQAFWINASYTIPIASKSISYVMKPFERCISVNILLVALNGTTIEGLKTTYTWLGRNYTRKTISGGILEISLPIPNVPGVHLLEYHISTSGGIQAYDSTFQIKVTSLTITSSSGFGLLPFVISISFSFSLVLLPSLRRRYLVG